MASRLQDVILRGLAAARPLATAVAKGTLYYSTDTATTDQSDGTNWNTYADGSSGAVAVVIPKLAAPFVTESEEVVYEPQIPIPGPPGPAGSGSGITQLTGNVTAGPGSGSQAATVSTAIKTRQIGITVDGAGSVLTTGVKGFKSFPVAGTITGVRLLADQSGSIVIDIWKDTYANYPPTVADTITAAAKPTITTAVKSEDTTLTGWTTSVSAGDIFGFNIDSVTTITRIILELTIVVT